MTKENIDLCGAAIQNAVLQQMKQNGFYFYEENEKHEERVKQHRQELLAIRIQLAVTLGNILDISLDEREASRLCNEIWDIAERKTERMLSRSIYFGNMEENRKDQIMTELMGWIMARKLERRGRNG